MPVYECTLEGCPNQYTDGTPKRRLYCTAHNALEPKPAPGKVSKENFEEAVCFLRAIEAIVKHDLMAFDVGGLTMASVATTARFVRVASGDILKLLKEKETV